MAFEVSNLLNSALELNALDSSVNNLNTSILLFKISLEILNVHFSSKTLKNLF